MKYTNTYKKLGLALIMVLILTACGGGGGNPKSAELTGLDRITEYAQNGGTAPTLQDYLDAGVTGIDSEAQLAEINQVVEGLVAEDVDTTVEVQALANALGVVVPTPDTTKPVITITGGATATVVQNTTYTDAGATATDDVDGTVTVTSTGTVDTSTVGDYTITYTATDSADNSATAIRTVTVTDTTAPVITITGGATATVVQNTTYTDAGATATDDVDGTVTVTSTGTVDTSTVGDYTITYTAIDSANNTTSATRTVTVEAFIITYNGTTYSTVTSPYTGKVWLDRNLGAAQVCTIYTDTACYGDYYQWGRDFDGHQDSTSANTTTQATDVNNAGNSFITSGSSPYDWTTADSNGSLRTVNWSKTDGTSVCPMGFRVPTLTELKAETLDNGVSNSATAFSNFLKLPVAGYRHNYAGGLNGQGTYGYVWTSSVNDFNSDIVNFNNSGAATNDYGRAYGLTVRCLRD